MKATDTAGRLMELFANELIRRLEESAAEMTAAELNVVAKVLNDNSVTLASVRRGDFGEFAKTVADEQFPFDEDSSSTYQ